MVAQNTSEVKPVPRERMLKRRSTWDFLSIGSLVGAAVFGFAGICNNIRDRFYKSFVEGHGESRTPFTYIIEKYCGQKGVLRSDDLKSPADGLYDAEWLRLQKGEITHAEYDTNIKKLTGEFKTEIHNELWNKFKVYSEGWKGWTIGIAQRYDKIGGTAKRDVSLGFAAVGMVTVGAMLLLKSTHRAINRLEDDLDDMRSRQQAR